MKNRFESLVDRIKLLPRADIEMHARMYEKRASEVPNARNNVSSSIAVALRLFLETSPPNLFLEQDGQRAERKTKAHVKREAAKVIPAD